MVAWVGACGQRCAQRTRGNVLDWGTPTVWITGLGGLKACGEEAPVHSKSAKQGGVGCGEALGEPRRAGMWLEEWECQWVWVPSDGVR